jgi:hypothetical protein
MKMFNLNKDGETKIDLLCDENGHNLSKFDTMFFNNNHYQI